MSVDVFVSVGARSTTEQEEFVRGVENLLTASEPKSDCVRPERMVARTALTDLDVQSLLLR